MEKFDLLVNDEYCDTIEAETIEEADRIAHQKDPYLTDKDYEIVRGNFLDGLENCDWVKIGGTYYYKIVAVREMGYDPHNRKPKKSLKDGSSRVARCNMVWDCFGVNK